MSDLSITAFPEVLERHGIDLSALGCVMLPVEPFNVLETHPGHLREEDLYVSQNPGRYWVKGNVGGEGAHLTILFGLLAPAWQWEESIRELLYSWEPPTELRLSRFSIFDSPFPDEPYACIVAEVDPDERLLDARARLQFLPHVNTFTAYRPHVTVAYVRAEAAPRWLETLSVGGLSLTPTGGLDLGRRD